MGVPKCLQMSHRASFISMIVLTLTFFFVEIVVGYATNSMALVADSFHMLSDVVSLFVGYIALRYSKASTTNGRYTFGWARAEVLGALVNAVFLVALCFSIFVEALKRIIIPEAIDQPKLVLLTGAIGLFVNLIGLFLFHQTGHGHSHGAGGSHGHSHGGGGGHSHNNHGHSHGHGHNNKNHTSTKAVANGTSHSHGGGDDKTTAASISASEGGEAVDAPLLLTQEDGEVFSENKDASEDKQLVVCGEDSTVMTPNKDSTASTDADNSPKSSTQLNIRGVYLHVLGDALGSVIVMVSAVIILYANGKWTVYVDPSMSIMLVIIILKTSIPLLKESSMILMQTVPTHLKIQEMKDRLIDQIPGVVSVHEFHVWQLAGSKIIASAHVQCETLADYMAIANQLKEFFHNEGIHSTTIQPEFIEKPEIYGNGDEQILKDCILECDPNCAERMCCVPNTTTDVTTTTTTSTTVTTATSTMVNKDVAVDIEKNTIVTSPNGNLTSPNGTVTA